MNNNIVIENARIGFRNFSGKEGRFNPAGRRTFCVFLEPEIASQLATDGWNIRWLEPRNIDEDKQAYLSVSVNFGRMPPKIIVITSKNKTVLEENTVNILDWAEIENVDLIIHPYKWEVNGKTGIKAYAKAMYVTIVEDQFEAKYRDIPDSAQSSILEEDDAPPF